MGFFVIFTGIREDSKTARAPIFREKTKKWRKNLVVSRITPTFAAVIERASGMPQIIQAIGVWCNGNTTDSGPVFPGSSPGTPTKAAASFNRSLPRFFLLPLAAMPCRRGAAAGGAQRKRPSQPVRLATAFSFLRREGDSNPRYPLGVYTLSRRASSTTRASLLWG